MEPEKRETIHILMVDDHADTITVLERVLTRRGYRVTTAATVQQALCVDESFDVLLCDIQLPDGTGHELLAHLQRDRRFAAIAMSGFGTAADVEQSIAAGFSEHLIKPFTTEQLSDAIVRHVQ